MNRNSTSSVGAFHPIIFFVFVYGISLFMAIFVCRAIYYGIHSAKETTVQSEESGVKEKAKESQSTASLAY